MVESQANRQLALLTHLILIELPWSVPHSTRFTKRPILIIRPTVLTTRALTQYVSLPMLVTKHLAKLAQLTVPAIQLMIVT